MDNHVLLLQQRITAAIMEQLNSLFGLADIVYLNLWLEGPHYELALNNNHYSEQLRLALDNAHYTNVCIDGIHIGTKIPGQTRRIITLIEEHVWLTLTPQSINIPEDIAEGHTIATISAMSPSGGSQGASSGALLAESYLLQADEQHVWHIGRGEIVDRPGKFRQNDIAIVPSERHVSSMQADISWREGKFYITPCPSGCSAMGGAPTKVLRDGKTIDLLSPSVAVPLTDNDIIELGRTVKLRFNTINDN